MCGVDIPIPTFDVALTCVILRSLINHQARTNVKTAGIKLTIASPPTMKCLIALSSNGGLTGSLLIITGGMGSGKTSILAEASDLLALRQITHAAIDVDALGLARLPSEACNDATMYINLRSVGKNYAACGVQRFLVARAMEGRAELDRCRHIFSTANTVVCRLTASIATMEHRVKMREIGVSRRDYVARVAKLNGILDDVRLEDFTVSNENRSSTDVALEMLVKAGWISH
jgi:hypothetical protein